MSPDEKRLISLSVVIPMFNESYRMEIGVKKILTFLAAHYPVSEVWLVNDGSTDDTVAQAKELVPEYPALKIDVIGFPENCGKGAAVREGMRRATGDVQLFVDADEATPMDELNRLLPMVLTDRTIIIGSRALDRSKLERRQPFWREQMGRCFNFGMRWITGLPYQDTQCGFKLFGREAARICFSQQKLDGFAFDVELLWLARRFQLEVHEVPVRWRHVPQSRVRAIRDSLQMAWDALRVRWIHRHL